MCVTVCSLIGMLLPLNADDSEERPEYKFEVEG